tara:strand:+ start:349 stop:537 length:189 start_codon:yes stop_codon:yes gene_type:complete
MADKKKPPSYAIGVRQPGGTYKWIPFSKAPKSLMSEIAKQGFTPFKDTPKKVFSATKKSNAK